jgi:immune inhibitor A
MALLLVTAVAIRAARAFSEPYSVTQPDGTTLTLTLHGDEHGHWTMTSDGVLVVNRGEGYYVAAIDDAGMLTATPLLAHSLQQRTPAEQAVCQQQRERQERFFERISKECDAGMRRAMVTGTKYFPHQGSPRSLVVLVNFQDVQFTSSDPVAQFNQYFSGETQQNLGQYEHNNVVSVRKYFEQSSGGQFTPQFDVVGPFTLSHDMAYYGEDSGDAGSDKNYYAFTNEAIQLADELVDFHDYDNNGDGEAELVCVIYAGYGQSVSGNPSNTIWPKCGYRGFNTADGVRVGYMNCNSELRRLNSTTPTAINGIGVFVHEFSHGMGLPDLYPNTTTARTYDNQSMEFFDLMDYGEYGKNGYAPVPYTAWEREVMGWTEVEVLTETRKDMELLPLVQGGKAYKFGNGANSEEYIYLENMQPVNTTNPTLGAYYGHGLVAYHVAYSSDHVNMADYPNNVGGKPRMAVVPASGLLVSGYRFVPTGQTVTADKPYTQAEYLNSMRQAPFPGTEGVTSLTDEQQLPNYLFYQYAADGTSQTGYNLTDIAEDTATGVVTFHFWKGEPQLTDISAVSSQSRRGTATYYMLDGRRVDRDIRLMPKGIYVTQGKKVVR